MQNKTSPIILFLFLGLFTVRAGVAQTLQDIQIHNPHYFEQFTPGYVPPPSSAQSTSVAAPQTNSIYSNTQQENQEFEDFLTGMNLVGITIKVEGTNINIITDQKMILASLPVLQERGIISSEVTNKQVKALPFLVSFTIMRNLIAAIVFGVYRYTHADRLHFNIYLTVLDDYGNDEHHLIFSFDFSRALFKRINWDNFSPSKLEKVAPNFVITPWLEDKAGGEIRSATETH